MQRRRQSWVGVLVFGVLMGVGYIWQRDHGGSLLASVVGDYQSTVGYTIDGQQLRISGVSGGHSSLDVIVLYDADHVTLDSIDSSYQYVVEDDSSSFVRVQLHQLPLVWKQTGLVTMTRSGSMDKVVVSDVGVRADDGSFRSLSVATDSLCIGTDCYHE